MKGLRGVQVLVLGLGESGLAMARWCAANGAAVRVWDSREAPPQAGALAADVPSAVLVTGVLDDAAFDGVALALKSPGLAPADARIAAPLARALERGVLLQGELELFARALADLRTAHGYAPKVIAITGTNGKTTTTALCGLMVARCGRRVAVAGNIGPTMLGTLAQALALEGLEDGEVGAVLPDTIALSEVAASPPHAVLDEDAIGSGPPAHLVPPPPPGPLFRHLPEAWVLELSSFQLDDVQAFEPDAAALLNLSEDHLDWHGSMDAYAAAKARVFGRAAVMVVNGDDAAVERIAASLQPVPVSTRVGGRTRLTQAASRRVVRFGLRPPPSAGDWGLLAENGIAWLARAMPADETRVRSARAKRSDAAAVAAAATAATATAAGDDLVVQRLMPADALRIRGRHNAANALAALALGEAIGCPVAPMLHALREYAGEPHRVQFVASVGGVDAFDDSKGTNVGATVAALNGLGADRAPAKLVVILGGDGKGQDFAPLAEPVRRHARAVATLGRDAARVEAALDVAAPAAGVPLARHATLEAATRWAFAQAVPGDAVLLSPACASLDMFRNYAHRADVFVAEVHAIAADQGEVVA